MNQNDLAVDAPLERGVRPLPEPAFFGCTCGLLREDSWTADQMRTYAAQQVAAEMAKMLRYAEIAQSLCSDPVEALRVYCKA